MRAAFLAAIVGATLLWSSGGRAEKKESADLRLETSDRLALQIGAADELSVTLRARDGQTISRDGDVELVARARPAEALRLGKSRLGRRDAADPRADAPRFDLAVEAVSAGSATVELEAAAWVCGQHTCVPARARRRIRVEVAAPVPDAGPPDAAR